MESSYDSFDQAHWYLPAKTRKLFAQFKGIEAPIAYRWDDATLTVQSKRGVRLAHPH